MPEAPTQSDSVDRRPPVVQAVALVWRAAPGWSVANAVLAVAMGVLPLASVYLVKLVVDAVMAGIAASDKAAAFEQVATLIGLAVGVVLVAALCNALARLVSEGQSLAVTDYMFDVIHSKSIDVDLEYYETPAYYDTLHRAQQEAAFRPTQVVSSLAQVGQHGVSLLAMAGLLISFHWTVAVLLVVTAVPGLLARLRYSGILFRWRRQRTHAERMSHYLHTVLTGEPHAKEVRIFDLGSVFRERFRALRRVLRKERLAISSKQAAVDFGTQALGAVVLFGLLAFIAYRAVYGFITLGGMVMYFQAVQRSQTALRQMLSSVAMLYENSLFFRNVAEFLTLGPALSSPAQPKPAPRPMTSGIVFDHVDFRYPGRETLALSDVCLTVAPGEVVALVGENGSGKTTLIKLLCRLYDPAEGTVRADGLDLRELDMLGWRRSISVIFQDYARYFLSARENIWLGNAELPVEDDRVEWAARRAGAHEVIARLPSGYDTTLGKRFDEGVELSVGEWQKVALARAFVRDAQVIVLDEPTSSMDAKAEYEVFQRFRELLEGRTAILISHRFSTVRMADRIYVLDEGGIAEHGTHDELVARDGTYAKLFHMQAQSYR